MKKTPYIDPQDFRSQATGGGATLKEARAAGNARQYHVFSRASEAARKLFSRDKGRIDPTRPGPLPPTFADSSQF